MAERFASSKRIKNLDPDPEAVRGSDPGLDPGRARNLVLNLAQSLARNLAPSLVVVPRANPRPTSAADLAARPLEATSYWLTLPHPAR